MSQNNKAQKVQLLWSKYSTKCNEIFELIKQNGLTSFEYIQVDNIKIRTLVKEKYGITGVPSIVLRFKSGKFKVLQGNDMIDWLATVIRSIRDQTNDQQQQSQLQPQQHNYQTDDNEYPDNEYPEDEYPDDEYNVDHESDNRSIAKTRRMRDPREDARLMDQEAMERQMKTLKKGGIVKISDEETGVEFQFGGGPPKASNTRTKQKREKLKDKARTFEEQRKKMNGDSDDEIYTGSINNANGTNDRYGDDGDDGNDGEDYGYLSDDEYSSSPPPPPPQSQSKKPSGDIKARAAAMEMERNKTDERNKQRGFIGNPRTLSMKE